MSLRERITIFRSSFQFRLFSLFTLLTAVATIVLGTLFYLYESNHQRLTAQENLQLRTQAFASVVRLSLYGEHRENMESITREALLAPGIKGIEITASDGRLLVRLPAQFHDDASFMSSKAEVRIVIHNFMPESAVSAYRNEKAELIGYVKLYRSNADLIASLRTLVFTTILSALIFWLFVAISSYLLLQRMTLSFRNLMSGLERVREGNYDLPVSISGTDEPSRACVALNMLAVELKEREQANKRLSAELLNAVNAEKDANEMLKSEAIERERAKLALKSLVESLPVGIVWSDADGVIEFHNRFILDHLGYLPEEIHTIEQLLQRACPEPLYCEQINDAHRAVKEDDAAVLEWKEIRILRKDGTDCIMSWGVQLSGGRVVDILIDMTDHELLLQQLVRNDKLESLGVMAGGIAHNFNNVLTGIMGYISFANKFIDESNRAYPLLCKAEEATRRAAGLANQLLTFARGGAPFKKPASAADLIKESVSLTLHGSQVKCHIELPPDLHTVFVDEGQICQVFNCLCINAQQAMPGGGSLVISGRNVNSATEHLPVQAEGSYVELSFKDSGCGIAEKDRAHIFTPYFTTKAEIGTGLGLATAHSILTRHGGSIAFVSSVGEGTTFTMYLPVIDEAPLAASFVKPESAAAVAGAAILVMDDEMLIRELAGDMLEQLGFQAHTVADGQEAVAAYRKAAEAGSPYKAAILDLTIPGGMGGAETARHILASDPAARLIVSSGYSNDAIMNDFEQYGFYAAIAKPYAVDSLTLVLNKILAEAS